MKVKELQNEIIRLKEEKGFCILAHAYQGQEICEIADYVGGSYGLSVEAAADERKNIIMCGVRFMAETCKILSPDKKVFMPNPLAGCPMADQYDAAAVRRLREENPGYAVVAYINTSTELKTEADVCVTSSSAVKICKGIDADKILFIPDPNLGAYVSASVPEKEFKFVPGGCPRHAEITEEEVLKARELHPNALLLVHPECRPEVVKHADYIGSTTGIMKFAKESEEKEFIIGTENSIVEHLQYDAPDKSFYPLSVNLTCMDMKVTTLMDVYNVLVSKGGEEIELPEETAKKARKSIDRMLEDFTNTSQK